MDSYKENDMIPLNELSLWAIIALLTVPALLVVLYYEIRYSWGLRMERGLYSRSLG